MGIIQITTDTAGQINVNPRRVKIITTDNLATVTTAGYLNVPALEGYTIQNTDVIDMWYGATGTQFSITTPGTYEVFTPSISGTGVITLVAWSNPGDVLLPVVANHIATFNGTSGQIYSPTATTIINSGGLQAGLDATAGTVSSFPSTTASGKLVLAAVNNSSGAFNTTISNASAVGQSQVVSIPDGGATTSNFIISKSAGTQHITAGSLEVDAGNLIAGISGTAGFLQSFPASANGSLKVAAVANTGNTITTISNDAMGQASIVNIPDPANAVGQFMIGATATPFVSGNFPKASGTAGLFIDSGVSGTSVSTAVTQLGALHQVSITFNTAQVVTAYDTPLQIVANPLSSQMILVLQATVYTASTGNTPYATGTAPIIQYSSGGTNGAHGAGTIATATGLVAGDITAATSQVRNLFGFATGAQTGLSGLGLYFSNATGDYTAGTGTSITITVVYQLLTATV